MEIVIILAILAAGWLGWTQWKKAEDKRASRPTGNWGDPSGTGPADDSPKWGGKPDEAHDDDLEKPKAKAKKPRAKKKKRATRKRSGGRKKSKEGDSEGEK